MQAVVAAAPPAQHPIGVTATGYDGCLFLQLLFDRQKLSPRQAGAIGQAMLARLSQAASPREEPR